MSQNYSVVIHSNNPTDTEKIGELIGNNMGGGEIIELVGDLGSGKTTFVRGFTKGSGSTDQVSSPSFTINKVYQSPNKQIHHFDFYRLSDPGITEYELGDLMGDKRNVIVIEWAKLIEDILPKYRIKIEFNVVDNDKREMIINSPSEINYLDEFK